MRRVCGIVEFQPIINHHRHQLPDQRGVVSSPILGWLHYDYWLSHVLAVNGSIQTCLTDLASRVEQRLLSPAVLRKKSVDNQWIYQKASIYPSNLVEISLTENLRNAKTFHAMAAPFYKGGDLRAAGPDGRDIEIVVVKEKGLNFPRVREHIQSVPTRLPYRCWCDDSWRPPRRRVPRPAWAAGTRSAERTTRSASGSMVTTPFRRYGVWAWNPY